MEAREKEGAGVFEGDMVNEGEGHAVGEVEREREGDEVVEGLGLTVPPSLLFLRPPVGEGVRVTPFGVGVPQSGVGVKEAEKRPQASSPAAVRRREVVLPEGAAIWATTTPSRRGSPVMAMTLALRVMLPPVRGRSGA